MSSTTFLIVLDGVIRKTGTQAVIRTGRALYDGLAEVGRVVLLTGTDTEKADWFVKTNGLVRHAAVIPEDPTASDTAIGRRLDQVYKARAQGSAVEFVVDSDPSIGAALLDAGIPVLHMLHPVYSHPTFRPDYDGTATPWDELTSHLAYQERLRAENPLSFEVEE